MGDENSNTGKWRLIYHDVNFKGRAEFVRLMLEDAGIQYEETSENLYGPTGLCDAFRAAGSGAEGLEAGAEKNIMADTSPWPVMFPPILHHTPPGDSPEEAGTFINHTAAILRYIAARLGYMPEAVSDIAKADQITLDCMDLFAEVNQAFHPVNPKASYSSQKEEADKAVKAYAASRLLVWLGHIEKLILRLQPSGDGPLIAGKASFADFALFHTLDAVAAQFADAWAGANVPAAKRWADWMRQRPSLQPYFASSRRKPWEGTSMM
mmetsp:Transcript_27175/g.63220  ORF Transcript_27175/g.63220 Transcript_27175/m.63220 type:complete len:266 (-) Transcript_27175:76-873(-)